MFNAKVATLKIERILSIISSFFTKLFNTVAPPGTTITTADGMLSRKFGDLSGVLRPGSKGVSGLQSIERGLHGSLLGRGEQVVIFVSSVSHLTSSRVSTLFQTIGSINSFPGIVCMLLCSRRGITRTLRHSTHSKKCRFLRGVIRIPVLVPRPSKITIQAGLGNSLVSVRGGHSSSGALSPESRRVFDGYIDLFVAAPEETGLLLGGIGLDCSALNTSVRLFSLTKVAYVRTFYPGLCR